MCMPTQHVIRAMLRIAGLWHNAAQSNSDNYKHTVVGTL